MFVLDHANINVTDIERSIKFYGEAFGLKEIRRKVAEDGSYIIVFLGDGQSSFKMELTWLRDKQGPYNLGDNESHLCFRTDDFEAALALHKKMGIVSYENLAMGVYFIVDPDGYWQEVAPRQ
jgi:lactoylglutathione lyase